MTRVRFPSKVGIFFFSPPRPDLLLDPASYPMGTEGSFPVGGKAAGPWSWPLTSI